MEDVLQLGWKEVNQESKNIIQSQLECCGWEGVQEFAGTSHPIDDSCYERVTPTLSGIAVASVPRTQAVQQDR